MVPRFELLTLILALTLDGRVHMSQIIGGREAEPHSRPYMVFLERQQGNEKKICGGFLLNEDFVVTAAHCINASDEVFLGAHSWSKMNGVQRIKVGKAFPHQKYNSETYENDIMLLKLKSKAKFSQNVKPIALGEESSNSLPKSCSVAGWGRTKKGGVGSDVLMEVNVTLVEHEGCEKESLYCSEGNTGPYMGDSGGPLVCESGEAYGVVSHLLEKSDGRNIYTFSKISDHRKWIDQTIGKV